MPWIQLQIPADPDTADQLEDLLMEMGADAVTMEDAADQPIFEPDPGTTPLWGDTRVTGLFDADQDIEQICSAIRDAWHQQTQQELPDIEVTLVEDKDWERAWMDDFQPLKFGHRLWIVPSWHAAPEPEAANLLLDPGLAFGTGTHPTTALCLEWLDATEVEGCQVIDYGCGSGILALAALQHLPHWGLLALFVLCFGLSAGARGPIITTQMAELFAGRGLASIFGATNIGQGCGAALGAFIAGFLYDTTGGYNTGFVISLTFALVGLSMFWVVPAIRHGKRPG